MAECKNCGDDGTFKDKRGRTWEMFIDYSYYHMTCVRIEGERDFNSPLSFHFATSEKGKQFAELLKVAS